MAGTSRKSLWWGLGSVALVVVAVATYLGESSGRNSPRAPEAFCRAAGRFEHQAEKSPRDLERQIPFVEQLAATAPKTIRADAQTFLEAMQRVERDPSVKDDPAVKRAVDSVNRYASQGCGVFDRNGGI